MKYYIVCMALFLAMVEVKGYGVLQTHGFLENVKNEECLRKSGANVKEVLDFFYKFPDDNTEALKCHFLCLLESKNLMKDGVFTPPLGANEEEKTLLDNCRGTKAKQDCRTAYFIFRCLRNFDGGKESGETYEMYEVY